MQNGIPCIYVRDGVEEVGEVFGGEIICTCIQTCAFHMDICRECVVEEWWRMNTE